MTTKEADFWFNIALCVSLVLFLIEVLVNSCVVDDFKFSFFFWLDIIATISLLPDISFMLDLMQDLVGMQKFSLSADVIPGQFASTDASSDKIQKIVKSLRLIRLIRIIKLYKYAAKSSNEAEEARLREQ
jgi:hypothetical protein